MRRSSLTKKNHLISCEPLWRKRHESSIDLGCAQYDGPEVIGSVIFDQEVAAIGRNWTAS